jgi:CRP-like cAMP-binding protein
MKTDTKQISAQPLIEYFARLIPLTNEEKELVATKFQSRLFRKRQFLLQEGDVCKVFNFVVSGCLRMYKIDDSGTVHIIQFATEEWWITDIGSFYKEQPSAMNIDAYEDTVVLQIKHDDLLQLYVQAPKFDRIFRVLIENSFARLQERLLQNISSTAKERYISFLDQYAHLVNRIPNTQIAAYLGITPEFLSKIRSERLSDK